MRPNPSQLKTTFLRCTLGLLNSAIMIAASGAVQSVAQTSEAEMRLRERMSAYWTAMENNSYEVAVQYLHPESRSQFTHRIPKGRVLKWKIHKLVFNEDQTACDTITLVTKPVPVFGGTLDFPLNNRWELVDGEWYFRIPWKEGENPLLKIFQEKRAAAPDVAQAEAGPSKLNKADLQVLRDKLPQLVPDPANPSSVHFGEKAAFRYHYGNKESVPIRIVSAYADCHCTAVKKEYPEIAPGEIGTLEITLDTFGLPLGPIIKDVRVQFSHFPDPVTLWLNIENQPNFVLSPARVDFGMVETGNRVQREVRVLNNSGRPLKILSKIKSDPRLDYSLDKTSLERNETLLVTLRYDPGPSGEFIDNLLLQTDLNAEPLIAIPIQGVVGPSKK